MTQLYTVTTINSEAHFKEIYFNCNICTRYKQIL